VAARVDALEGAKSEATLKRLIMTEPRTHRRVVRSRKKSAVPLSKLRTSDAVKTIVDHPRRLEELLGLLEDKDRSVRGKAATAVARLSESHPARLLRVTQRLKEALADDSAYVRWYVVYALGKLGSYSPSQSRAFLNDLVSRLEDENRVVRSVACKALSNVASRNPLIIEEFFQTLKKEVPPPIARVLRKLKTGAR
jgi:HEAT repeat protein